MLTIDNFLPVFSFIQDVGSHILMFFYSMGELFQFDILNNNLSQFNVSFISPLNDVLYTLDFGASAVSTILSDIVDIFLKLFNTLPLIVASNTTDVLPFGIATISLLVGLSLVFFFIDLFKNTLPK